MADLMARCGFNTLRNFNRVFKAVTGYKVHQYISQKRLLRAGELIRAGVPVMKAAEQAGFEEYSTFLRAFRGTFHMSPREFR